MKKIVLSLVLVLSLLLVLGGCTKKKSKAKTAAAGPKYKIGLVFDIGGRGDKSFNDSALAGLVHVAKQYKGYIKDDPDNVNFGSEIEMKYLEPKAGGQDREQLLRVLAEQGYNLIYGIGFMFSDPLAKVAKDFPNVHFAIVDGFIPDLNENSNITCLLFKEHEGSFLVGAVAGLMNNGGKIGFIGGMDIPLIHKFEGGYIAGALYVNPKLRDESMILAQYIGKDPSAFKDAPAAYNIASNMYKQGAAVIYHAAGASGDGLFQAAEKYKKLAIGVDSDQGLIYSTAKDAATRARGKYILTSMLKRVDNAVYTTATELINNGKV
ncbi:MAG: BMP family ABC transporter substrate-binding protein, partial [Spirochaetes bacterium]